MSRRPGAGWLLCLGLLVPGPLRAEEAVRQVLAGVRVNDIAFDRDAYVVGTSSGLLYLDKEFRVKTSRAGTGPVTALVQDGGALFIGSACGLYKEQKGRWSRVPLIEGEAACDGSQSVGAMCLNREKRRATLFLSLEDHTIESVESLGVYAFDVAKGSAARFDALQPFGGLRMTAVLCAGATVFFGSDDESDSAHPGQVFAVSLSSPSASLISEGMPKADELDVGEVTALRRAGSRLFVGRYAGYGTGQCVLAAGDAGRWSCLLRSEADALEGVSAVEKFSKGVLAASGLMANVDAARVFYVDEGLAVSEVKGLPLRGQIVNLRVRAGRVFLCTTDGLVVVPGRQVEGAIPRRRLP
ncbi:MAG: hypothetical protein HY927_06660 [Elusimicrobia bacterium]|nr:hypothetical protein [Elusimicrobiota bacterium]